MRAIPVGNLKARLKARELTVGSWITLADPSLAEIMARSGFDWLTIDMEHSAIELADAQRLIRTVESLGVPPLVRVSINERIVIQRVMDAGAHGVIVPQVNSPEEAAQAVAGACYPPVGNRGVGLARAQGYGTRFEDYKAWGEESTVVIVQIENIRAVDHLEAILTTPGVDGFVIGPYDLSASMGHPGQWDRPEVREALAEIDQVASRLGSLRGFHVIPPEPDALQEKIDLGYQFVAFSLDTLFLTRKIESELADVRRRNPGSVG
jgi:2-keto-3-deoxy-L-rhamnonate aldolase RhmA